jgi:hypothetical protein
VTTDLDSILSGGGAAAPAPETTEPTSPTPDADLPQPNSVAVPEGEAEPQGDERGMVPLAALQESRGKVKRYTEQVADFERRLKESNEHAERRFNDLIARLQPQQQQPQQPQEEPDFWADPKAAIQSWLAPVVGQLQSSTEQRFDVVTRSLAEQHLGADKVKAAEDAFVNAAKAGQVDQSDWLRVKDAPNRYAAAVKWHNDQAIKAELQQAGGDLGSLREKIKAEILAELETQQGTGTAPAPANNGAAPRPVMPTNLASARNVGVRSGPAWGGPRPLADIFSRK